MNSGLASKEAQFSRAGFQNNTTGHFLALPNEVLEDIFGFIDPIDLHESVSVVNKRIYDVIQNENFWRLRFQQRNCFRSSAYSPYLKHLGLYSHKWKSGEDMRWQDICISFERAKKLWFDNCKTIDIEAGYLTADAVHLMEKQDILLTGSRSRMLEVWNLNEPSKPVKSTSAHKSWISGVSTLEDMIITSSFDYVVKMWSASRLEPLAYLNVLNAVMSIDVRPRMIVCCTFPDLIIIDPRIARPDNFYSSPMPKGSAVQIKFWKEYVIIATRNKKLIKYDLRQQKIVDSTDIVTKNPPRVMEIKDDIAYIGDTAGYVYLYDLLENYQLIDEYQVSENAQIRFLSPRDGYMIVGSKDGQLRVVSNVKRNQESFLLSSIDLGNEIITGHYRNNNFAVVTNHANVKVFLPQRIPDHVKDTQELCQEMGMEC
ncbi:WD domain, G-beta repeat [Nesidiocoris tenuis]|uniref:WD domain, G-beta repeat n=1 Tax=Nesidiocoris tenuis TaxID=355587 RepID=A0ABN7AGH0_9HEMI|nr:WD domain, G-beta repeat [Nesidiocoris tenuis]